MHRALVNMLPSWMFIALLMAFFLLSATIFFFAVRRYFPKLLTEQMSPAFTVMGTSYGFLLGFVIAILWQNYTAATNIVATEASNINLLINNLQLFPPDVQLKLIKVIRVYIDILKDHEWEAMRWGEPAHETWRTINDLYKTLLTIKPEGTLENQAYGSILRHLDSISENRATRIHMLHTIIPVGVRVLLLAGALFIVFSVTVNDTKNKLNHFITVMMVCFLLAFNLGLAFLLAFPYSGDIGVSGEMLNKVIPERLNNMEAKLKGM